jgi:two-component system, OmpR family, sensor histidine kinase KdpD
MGMLFGSLAVVAATTALLYAIPNINPTTVALTLLLVVLGTATIARLRVAIVVALVATLALNYFFLPPVGTFTIADPQNWIALFAFLIVAVTASQLSTAAKDRALARQKAELASTLLASLSHDVRTPLTAIRVAVENLTGSLSADERRAQVAAATSEITRLTRLFDDIVDMARIDAAAIDIDRQWVGAVDVVDAALVAVQPMFDGHALHVNADDEMEAEIDPRLASGALSHLLENAAQYSPHHSAIMVSASVRADGLHVSVTDEGPGLAADEIDYLFDRFYRGRTAHQRSSGTGMGLAITRGLLAAVGGRVWAENVPTGGARFSMVVPGRVRGVTVP